MQAEEAKKGSVFKIIREADFQCLESLLNEYRFLYEIELENRRSIEEKITSRLSFLAVIITLVSVQIEPIWVSNSGETLAKAFFLISIACLLCQIVFFYLTFFSTKLIYIENDVVATRNHHQKLYNDKMKCFGKHRYKITTLDELALLGYIRDSYIRCAAHNRKINKSKKTKLLIFDNFTVINLLLTLTNYFFLYFTQSTIQWIFSGI